MDRTLASIFTEDAAWNVFATADRAHFLRNPPKPPFIVVMTDAKIAHMVWRAAITLDPDYWFVQLGRRSLGVDRLLALQALDASTQICEAMAMAQDDASTQMAGKPRRKPAKAKAPARHVFTDLDPKLLSSGNGSVRANARTFAMEHGMHEQLAVLDRLGPGEFWALHALVFSSPDPAYKPRPIILGALPKGSSDKS